MRVAFLLSGRIHGYTVSTERLADARCFLLHSDALRRGGDPISDSTNVEKGVNKIMAKRIDENGTAWYFSKKDNAEHTLPSVEYFASFTPERRREELSELFDEYEIPAEEREALYAKYSC